MAKAKAKKKTMVKGQQSLFKYMSSSPSPTPKKSKKEEEDEAAEDSPSSAGSQVENLDPKETTKAKRKAAATAITTKTTAKTTTKKKAEEEEPAKKRVKKNDKQKNDEEKKEMEENDNDNDMEVEVEEEKKEAKYPDGTKIYKNFGDHGWFHGTVLSFDGDTYLVQYDDGDKEDLSETELEDVLEKPNDKSSKKATTTSRASRRRASNYKEDSDDDEEEEAILVDSDDEEPKPKKKASSRRTAKTDSKKKKRKTDDDDEDFVTDGAKDDDDDELDADMDDDDDDEDAMEVEEAKPKKKAATKKKAAAKKKGKKKSDDDDDDMHVEENLNAVQRDFQNKLAKDLKAVDPKNNPQKLPENGPFVDPVGVDPTHGIVEEIVSAQVRKVGRLLQGVAERQRQNRDEEPPMGELQYPLRLQTACSGTDAPSIALGLIKESIDKMLPHDQAFFEYSHEMSCEIEPFKQAYIGRNFPGVPLFPDITKLTESEQVLDVYGREQTLPDGNLFVAGTSCKDFSMLKTRYRLDIEDKGTSGETFLAAVEFLEQKQPPVAIFENVDKAPWDKMQEYIRGRVNLAERNTLQGIVGGKTKNTDAETHLKFSVDDEGRYIAEEIPRQVGIKAGVVVEGFVKGGKKSSNVQPLVCPKEKRKGGLVTLGQLAKRHKIDLEADTLVMEKKARYCTKLFRLDTKEYGLPQTRNRKYLFIWRSDDPDDDLGDYFEDIMNHLKTPLLHSMDAFLLPDTHDRVRCFREALRSGPGLMVAKERAREKDFWNWEESRVKDLTLHLAYRKNCGIEERSRWITGWNVGGRKLLAPGCWPELFDCWNHRRLDLIDCFAASAARDAIARDALHHSFTWDMSQNVSRAPFRSGGVGVSGCVTPGGELLLPRKGRTAMGYEKLLLQGIPFSRLLLGPESEVQLSDLAGNAMSVSVVCATMLAAICAPQLRREMEASKSASLKDFGVNQKYDSSNGAVLAERGDLYNSERDTNAKDFADVFIDIAKELARDAFRSSVLCTCESSGTTTKDPTILQCLGCGWRVCHGCSHRYRTQCHKLSEIDAAGKDGRPDVNAFERKLRCVVPSILRLGQGTEEKIRGATGLESYSFELQQVDRKKGHWQLTYGAWEDHGSARQVAEIRVEIGSLTALDSQVGFAAYLRCFAPAIRHIKPHRGALKDSARIRYRIDDSNKSLPCWEIPASPTKCNLKIEGTGEVDSQRVQIGLNDVAAKSLKNHIVKKAFQVDIDSRNSMSHYHKKWKTWPKEIAMSGDESGRVNGTYSYVGCQQTVVHSALWRRDATEDQPAMYLFFRPDVIRTHLDVAVISPTPSYHDQEEISELHDWIPENALEEKTHKTKAKFLEWDQCPDGLKVEVPKPALAMVTQSQQFHERASLSSASEDAPVLCEVKGLSEDVISSLLEYNEANAGGSVSAIDLVGRSGTRNAKRLSIVAAPSLLKYAAQGKLPLEFSKWYQLTSSIQFGQCQVNVPARPAEQWREVRGQRMTVERFYDAEESNDYYQRLLNRPTAFKVNVIKPKGILEVRMAPTVAAHRAAAQLGGEESGSVVVDYCLAELSSMGEPDTKDFHVPNSDAHEETHVDGLVLPLYKRQAKALTRMLSIEDGKVPFSEEERSEHVLPGIGWCLIARASKKSPLRGGVLGDAIGSGKTVVTIALILAGATKARENRDIGSGRSSATLIVVPPGLVRQWDDERKKFTGSKLKCLIISDTDSLKKKSVKDLCEADIVIVPAGLIEEEPKKGDKKRRPYTEQLSTKAGAGRIPPAPTGYSQREAPTIEGTWVRNMASGPEIYVGNRGDQRKRDAQAYYGHCYSEAIAKLRKKKFAASERGVPIEYFTWERVVIDECHESLVTASKQETKAADFKEKARRGAREFLGVSQTNVKKRPLVATRGVWGLTGTPLLETEARVTELSNLMGGTYLTGASHHWRKEERESGRDLFLNQSEGTKSREYRCAVWEACDAYVNTACQRNCGPKLNVKLERKVIEVNMTQADGEAFLKESKKVDLESFSVTPDQLGEKAGDVLAVTASSTARHGALIQEIDSIREREADTKIIIFANATFGGYDSALKGLKESDQKFCHISNEKHSVQEQNEVISWFRHVDATDEDKARPRILLLSFEQAAGHNLQEACHDVIIYDPMYSGTDAVADASVEEQAVGRVMRQGQKYNVTVTRIVVRGPDGERCLDDVIVERNLDKDVLAAATSNFD